MHSDGESLFPVSIRNGFNLRSTAREPFALQVEVSPGSKNITGMNTYDVIAYNKLALVVAEDGLYQFDYSDLGNIKLLSKIGYKN